MSIDLAEIEQARSAIARLAAQMLAGELSYIEGSRALLAQLSAARADTMAEFRPFMGIDSETDRFPIGKVRELWQSSALLAMQPEMDAAEAWAKSVGAPACEKVLAWFDALTPDDF